jgi:hypothetical protein
VIGRTEITKNNIDSVIKAATEKVRQAYEKARVQAEQLLQARVPVDTGALKGSTRAESLSTVGALGGLGVGFSMNSFGNESSGKAYARWVNGGHHAANGNWIPAQPYFSQTVADVQADLSGDLKKVF